MTNEERMKELEYQVSVYQRILDIVVESATVRKVIKVIDTRSSAPSKDQSE